MAAIALPSTTDFSMNTLSDSLIDPRLLHLGGEDTVLEESAAFQSLDSIIHNDIADQSGHIQAMGLDIFLENATQITTTDSILTLPGRDFVESLSKINIVRCVRVEQHIKSLDEAFPKHCPMGNSRDYPTLFLYHCGKCTAYTTRSIQCLKVHEVTCKGTVEEVKDRPFVCTFEGCGLACTSLKNLQHHVISVHEWEHQKCHVQGCTSDRVFETREALNMHLRCHHRPIEPAVRCSFPGCTSTTLWAQYHNYEEHLRLRHKLVTVAARKVYLPDEAKLQKVAIPSTFESTSCPVGGTKSCKNVFQKADGLTRHLTRTHGLSIQDAQAITKNYRHGAAKKEAGSDVDGEEPEVKAGSDMDEEDDLFVL
jgi:hypothetical protein